MPKRALPAVVLAVLLASSPLHAAPCSNDQWQPTFVHDLDRDDWPYYVTADGNFLKLEHRQPGGFVPHACELLRGPQDLRDRRGFTTCQEYTRVQCGCSRNIPGNRTCAAFLTWNAAAAPPAPAVPPPQGPGASVAPPSGVGIVPPGGVSTAPPYGQPAAPPAYPPPARPPVATAMPAPAPAPFAAQPVSVPASDWQQAPQYRGALQPGPNGLVVQGGPWTNGRLKDGYYDGSRVFSTQSFDLSRGGDVHLRFLANGGGQYMGIYPRLLEGVGVRFLTTHHSWSNSVVIPDNTWMFAHLRVEPDGSYRISVARSNYDDRGGQSVYSNSGRLANPRGRLELHFVDNYAGPRASIVIGEAVVTAGGAPPASAGMAPPPATGGGRPAGATCRGPSDCASSICLLGVCAR
ncbi:MAG: hypothetical protein L6R19_20570 [Alphaproteobacteria bacterium]|nr:hypothetical protein [Alphaproteobacteria bacterium]